LDNFYPKLFEMFLIISKFQIATRNDVLDQLLSTQDKKLAWPLSWRNVHIHNKMAHFFQLKYFEN
jgi:hypothetical protein